MKEFLGRCPSKCQHLMQSMSVVVKPFISDIHHPHRYTPTLLFSAVFSPPLPPFTYTIWNRKWNGGTWCQYKSKGRILGWGIIPARDIGTFPPSHLVWSQQCSLHPAFDVQPRSECHFVNRGRSAVSAQAFDTSWRQLPLLGEALIIERKIQVGKAQMCHCLSTEICGDITHCKATVLAIPCHQAAAILSSFTLVLRADGNFRFFFIMNE